MVRAGELANKTGNVRVGAVNCAYNMRTCHRFDIRHYGEIQIFPPNQDPSLGDHEEYNGPVVASRMLSAAEQLGASAVVQGLSPHALMQRIQMAPRSTSSKAPVVSLWLVDYYRPGCPPCEQIKSSIRRLSMELQGVAKVATVNCGEERCHSVPHYPYFQLIVQREGQVPEKHVIDFDVDGHPGGLALKVAGMVFKHVIGLRWEEPTRAKRSDKDEL
mmetsp:Transcript_38471/g.96376  ORF Transcript_38471/g.96376 Transcript_38471/m.96376 type:complete len:217 (+) Transcript_38471:105-755(+)